MSAWRICEPSATHEAAHITGLQGRHAPAPRAGSVISGELDRETPSHQSRSSGPPDTIATHSAAKKPTHASNTPAPRDVAQAIEPAHHLRVGVWTSWDERLHRAQAIARPAVEA